MNEAPILEHVAAGRIDAATIEIVRGFGDELRRFIRANLDDSALAAETFARWSESVWRSLASFRGASSLRTWCYTIARRELAQSYKQRGREQRRALGLSAADDIPIAIRTETQQFLRTDVRSKLHERCRELPEEDRELLALRVEQRMSWLDIVAILEPEAEDARRVAARIRKRYERIKDQLRDELANASEPDD